MKTYLVTGGAGFIGSNFILYMLRKYRDIRIINLDKLTYAGNLENLREVENDPNYSFVWGDILDMDTLSAIFAHECVDCVVHFAAESHVDRSISDPGVFTEVNVIGTVNLLNVARAAWESAGEYRSGLKFLYVSTDEVYGSLGDEGLFTEESPLDPHSPYAASKTSAQLFVKAYGYTYGLPVNITCCSNNYGPYQFPEKMIPLIINNALTGKGLPIFGDGLQVRDWLYVDDHCKALDLVINRGKPGEIYNVGGSNERRNIDLIKAILACVKEKVPAAGEHLIQHVGDRKGHDRRYAIDASKIKAELGWYPDTSFDNGLRKTVNWYLSNRTWLDGVTSGTYQDYYEEMYGGR